MILMVLAITVISAFDLKCPEELERTFRAKFVCYNNTLVNRYSCLLDQDTNVYNESCTDNADYVRPGKYHVKKQCSFIFRRHGSLLLTMQYELSSFLKAVRLFIILFSESFWVPVEICFIGNYTTSFFLYRYFFPYQATML